MKTLGSGRIAAPPWSWAPAAFVLSLAASLLALPLRVGGLTVFWPAAGVVAGLLLVSQGAARWQALAGCTAGLATASLLGGRSLDLVAVFLLGNVLQALTFTAVLERLVGRPCRLDNLPAVASFVGASVALPAGFAWLTGAGLMATGRLPGSLTDFWFTLFSSHAIGLLTVTPAVLAVGRGGPLFGLRRREGWRALGLLAAFSAGALLLIGLAPGDDHHMLIITFALLYPAALWIAGRTSPAWCALALLALAVVVVGSTVAGVGLFAGRMQEAQLFLVVGATWMLTLGLVLDRQRAALGRAVASEAALLDSLAAGGGFSFDWSIVSDQATRKGQREILQAPSVTTAAAYFEHVHPEDRDPFVDTVRHLTPAQPGYHVVYRYLRDDGSTVWLEERGRAEFDDGGSLVRVQGIMMDVTARTQAEAALRAVARRKDEFIATLAHELRNPLAPMRSGLEVIAMASDDPPARQRAIAIVRRQLAHLVRLVDDLLDVSRIATGKLVLRREPVDLAVLLREAVDDATPLARERGQQLGLRVAPGEWRVDGDSARLMQVASNLFGNALRYTPRGGHVQVALEREGGTAVLAVRDDGIGIPPDKLEEVFELFAQVHGPRGFESDGLGIGLNLSRRLCGLHGGSLVAASAGPGRGSCFTARLPLLPAAAPALAPAATGAPADAGLRVLVVDDLADSADSLAMLLELCGHRVAVARGGAEALERLAGFDAQVALIDIGMPGMTGLDLARAIRARPGGPSMTLVAVSGWSRPEDRARSLAAGFDHHVAKPVDIDRLQALLRGEAPAPAPA